MVNSTVVLLAAWLLLVLASPTYAYVDPGSGAMLAQLLLGGAAGAVVLVRVYWNRLRALIGLRQRERNTDQKA
jgi:hypothetical protein